MNFIPQMEPSFDEKEIAAMNEYMASDAWLMEFQKTREVEKMIAEYTGAKYCSIMPNGTLSLTAALMAFGIGVGDEVIVPDFTMSATANAVEVLGAKVVFVDIERNTLCMDFDEMKKAVTSKTKAVMLVSISGRYNEQLYKFIDFCKENNIKLIEDAAQCLGSTFHNKQIGTFGDIGSYSFSVPKIITMGQGGALVTDNKELYDKIVNLRDFGREKSGSDHFVAKGLNLKFTDMQAVIGIEQMKKLPERVSRKKEIGKLYEKGLNGVLGIEMIKTDFDQTALWFYDILCEQRNELMEYLKNKGIGSRPFYPPLHSEPAFNVEGSFPVTEEISAKGLWLPSSVKLTDEQIEYICASIKEFYNKKV